MKSGVAANKRVALLSSGKVGQERMSEKVERLVRVNSRLKPVAKKCAGRYRSIRSGRWQGCASEYRHIGPRYRLYGSCSAEGHQGSRAIRRVESHPQRGTKRCQQVAGVSCGVSGLIISNALIVDHLRVSKT